MPDIQCHINATSIDSKPVEARCSNTNAAAAAVAAAAVVEAVPAAAAAQPEHAASP